MTCVVDDAFAADDDHVALQVIDFFDSFDQQNRR